MRCAWCVLRMVCVTRAVRMVCTAHGVCHTCGAHGVYCSVCTAQFAVQGTGLAVTEGPVGLAVTEGPWM